MRNHDLTCFVRANEITRKISVNSKPQVLKVAKSINFLVVKRGVIIPAVSQATALLLKNSARDFLCPTESFLITFYHIRENSWLSSSPTQFDIGKLFLLLYNFLTMQKVVVVPTFPMSKETEKIIEEADRAYQKGKLKDLRILFRWGRKRGPRKNCPLYFRKNVFRIVNN